MLKEISFNQPSQKNLIPKARNAFLLKESQGDVLSFKGLSAKDASFLVNDVLFPEGNFKAIKAIFKRYQEPIAKGINLIAEDLGVRTDNVGNLSRKELGIAIRTLKKPIEAFLDYAIKIEQRRGYNPKNAEVSSVLSDILCSETVTKKFIDNVKEAGLITGKEMWDMKLALLLGEGVTEKSYNFHNKLLILMYKFCQSDSKQAAKFKDIANKTALSGKTEIIAEDIIYNISNNLDAFTRR